MKRILLLMLLALGAMSSSAQAQMNLAWNNCITEPNQAANLAYACDGSRNGLPFRCVASAIAPIDLAAFVGAEVLIDIYGGIGPSEYPGGTPLPDFWRLGTGECRDGNVVFPTGMLGIGSNACLSPWTGAYTGGGYAYTSSADHARLRLTFARDTPTTMTSGQQYFTAVFAFDTWKDTDNGDGKCPGCCLPMVLALDQVVLYQTAGTAPQDIVPISTWGVRPWVTWQSSDGDNLPGCLPTPVKRSTWGSIKSTYR